MHCSFVLVMKRYSQVKLILLLVLDCCLRTKRQVHQVTYFATTDLHYIFLFCFLGGCSQKAHRDSDKEEPQLLPNETVQDMGNYSSFLCVIFIVFLLIPKMEQFLNN